MITKGNPEEVADTRMLAPSQRIPGLLRRPCSSPSQSRLLSWNENEKLDVVNIHYDVTPAKFVTMVASELGQLSPESCVNYLLKHLQKEAGEVQGGVM